MQFIELGPFKGQIIHQAFLAKYKRYDRVLNIGGIQRVPHTQRDQCHGPIHPGFPAIAVSKSFQCILFGKYQNNGFGLSTQLKSYRSRHGTVIFNGLTSDPQSPFTIFPANAKPGFDDLGKNQNSLGFFYKAFGSWNFLIKPLQSDLYTHIYLLGRRCKSHIGGKQ